MCKIHTYILFCDAGVMLLCLLELVWRSLPWLTSCSLPCCNGISVHLDFSFKLLGLNIWVCGYFLDSIVQSLLSFSSCLSLFVSLDLSRFFPCFSWSCSASTSVLLGLSHFVSFGVSLCLAYGVILVSSSSISMLSIPCMLLTCYRVVNWLAWVGFSSRWVYLLFSLWFIRICCQYCRWLSLIVYGC